MLLLRADNYLVITTRVNTNRCCKANADWPRKECTVHFIIVAVMHVETNPNKYMWSYQEIIKNYESTIGKTTTTQNYSEKATEKVIFEELLSSAFCYMCVLEEPPPPPPRPNEKKYRSAKFLNIGTQKKKKCS